MCIACGVDSGPSFFCRRCWRSTPLALKNDWWMWTKYGSVAPTDEEIAVFVEKRREKLNHETEKANGEKN